MAITIPSSYVDNYSKSLNEISDQAKLALIAALERIDYTQPIEDIREAAIKIMSAACAASTSVTAQMAAQFYTELRTIMGGSGFNAVANSMRNPDATDGAVQAFIQTLVDGGEPDEFIQRCAGRLDYENRKAAKKAIEYNAKKDPVRPLWAIVPTGDETCEYCIILASYGFVHSKSLVGHTHENCDCRLTPSWDRRTTIDGYQDKLAEYKQFYQDIQDVREDMPYELMERIELAKAKHEADLKSGTVNARWGTMNELAIIGRWLKANAY